MMVIHWHVLMMSLVIMAFLISIPQAWGSFLEESALDADFSEAESRDFSSLAGNAVPAATTTTPTKDPLCGPGTFWTPGQTSCLPCPEGTFSANNGAVTGKSASACQTCAPGTFAPGAYNRECAPCPVGKYGTLAGATSCSDCPLLKALICPNPGMTAPTPCPRGTRPSSGYYITSQCDACGNGNYCPDAGTLFPLYCPHGHWCNASDATPCSPGKWAHMGMTACEKCDAGYYCPDYGTSDWGRVPAQRDKQCSPGTWSGLGAAACEPCPANIPCRGWGMRKIPPVCQLGAYLDENQQCFLCPAGMFCSAQGITAGTPCPAGKFSNVGATACTACQPGSFSAAPRRLARCAPWVHGAKTRARPSRCVRRARSLPQRA